MSTPLPLEGVRILDLSRVLAGPYATMMLADLGADVIKVERPGVGDQTRAWGPPFAGGESAYYLAVNRNKRSLTLNLKDPRGRELLLELVKASDVLVENFRVGTMERLGLGYERLREVNPALIYCRITAYGPDGPYARRPGYDFILQAEGGIMSVTGPEEGPPYKVGVAWVDAFAAHELTIAVLAALRVRERTGRGQRVEVSLLEAVVVNMLNVASNYLVSGQIPRRYGNAHPNIVPYQVFQAADGYLALGVGDDAQWRRLCRAAGWEDLAADPRFATNPDRVRHRDELIPILEARIREKPLAHWLRILREADVSGGPINTLDRVFADPQVRHLGLVQEVPHPTAGTVPLVRSPFRFSETPVPIRRHPPLLGEHTEEILQELLGLSPEDVARLREEGVV